MIFPEGKTCLSLNCVINLYFKVAVKLLDVGNVHVPLVDDPDVAPGRTAADAVVSDFCVVEDSGDVSGCCVDGGQGPGVSSTSSTAIGPSVAPSRAPTIRRE